MATRDCATNTVVGRRRVASPRLTTGEERKRERYRLRIGLRGVLADDWFFGVRLETSQSNRSTNVTFGDDTSTITPTASGNTTTINGPFAKNSDGINVGQALPGLSWV